MSVSKLKSDYEEEVALAMKKYDVLKDLDLFVLDNSIRESTVGQLKGHTLEAKWKIYEEIKKCGFTDVVVASFNHMTRVDDVFVQQLVDRGENLDGLWAFSEITNSICNKMPNTEVVPIGLSKLQKFGLYNCILEIDLGDSTYDFNKFTMENMKELIKKWITWIHDNLNENAKVFVNFRDPPDVMPSHSERVFEIMEFFCQLPPRLRLFGVMFEEPAGMCMPEECGMWARYMKKIMKQYNWNGHLLVHVHEKFGYSETTQLQVLMDGATGTWGSLIREGAAMGNAATCITILNLIRLGNTKVIKKYNCQYLRKAAINITRLTTGSEPFITQIVYGARALDMVYSLQSDEFDMADFFEEKAPVRMTTMASPEMILHHLEGLFGKEKQFTVDIGLKMKETMLEDLRNNRKEEYMSKVGIAMLFDRSGGEITEEMRDLIEKEALASPHQRNLVKEIRRQWDEWDTKDVVQGDDLLQFDNFYDGFMAPYFSCYRCSDTAQALKALDMDQDGGVDWAEFMVYIKWALHEYPDVEDADELLDVAFRKGIMPAMRDELFKGKAKEKKEAEARNTGATSQN